MKHLLTPVLFLFIASNLFSQACSIQVSSTRDTMVCGQSAILSAFGKAQGQPVLTENFNSGGFGAGWAATPQAMFNNPCGASVDGTPYLWMGNSSPVPRIITTASFNLTTATAGVSICFDMKFATQGNAAPCEGPDEPNEGVHLQYSIDNGVTWVDINYFDPNGGNDPQLINWNNWCFTVPAAAISSNTKFRWFQDVDSGADYDHWGLDNVTIYYNDPNYNIVFQHDGYNAGATGGIDPTPVAPHTTTSYIVTMTNGTVTCADTVQVVVINPIVQPNAGADTTICNGTCVNLNGDAKVIQRVAGVRTYSNTQPEDIQNTFGTSTSVNINVQTLNMQSVQNNSILSVCITRLSYSGVGGGGFSDVRDLNIYLQCPDGTRILMVPAGSMIPASTTIFGFTIPDSIGCLNTCFVPAGPNISTGNGTRHTGSYQTQQSFNGLTGCTANGVWSLVVEPGSAGSLGSGTLYGWSITFDDPEAAYQGNFTWSPTTNMTNATTLTPNVCPPTGSTTSYTLTVSDTAGCVTASDVVNVTTHTCCSFAINAAVTQPACGASNGAINLTINPAGTYTYAWSDGPSTSANRTNLAAGAYHVTVTDAVNNCTKDTIITLNSSSTLNIMLSNPVDPTCAGSNGQVNATLTGGTAPYTIVIDTGSGTPQTIVSPIPVNNQTVGNLPAGTITVSVTDANGCQASTSVTLTAPANCCTFSISATSTQPTCGNSNGTASVTVQNGSGNYTYAWSNGETTANASNLAAGPVGVTVTDNGQACSKDTTFTLTSNSSLSLQLNNSINPTCAGSDGQVEVTLTGGTAPYTITIDTGGTPQTLVSPIPINNQTVGNLPAGTVNVSVSDAAGCQTSASVTLIAPTNCCTFTVSAAITQPGCGATDGGIVLTAANGSGNYTYTWANGSGTNTTASNLGAGNYAVTITDVGFANCNIDTTFSLTNPNAPVVSAPTIVDETCPASGDGSATINASGGTGTLTYLWNDANAQTTVTATALTSGTYGYTVTDANGCQATGTATVGAGTCCTLQILAAAVPPSCGQTTGTINVAVGTTGVAPYQYSIDGGSTFQSASTFNNVPSGTYSVLVQDGNACTDTATVTVPPGGANLTITATATNVTCFGYTDGTATATPNNGNTPFSYVWSNAATSATVNALAPGNYQVTVTDVAGCTGSATTTVAEPAELIIDLGNDVEACEGIPITISAGAGFVSYTWSSGEATENIAPTVSGIYTVTVIDANGCPATDQVLVTIHPIPLLSLGDDKLVYEGDHVPLVANISNGNGAGAYNWQPDTLLSCGVCGNTIAFAADTILYVLNYTDNNGCSATDSIVLNVLPVTEIFWPNAFSPNGDGNNDIFFPYGNNVKLIDWKIFNRWGEKIFESTNFFEGWDGTYKGKPQNPNVYIYEATATLMNGNTKKFKGSFVLIR